MLRMKPLKEIALTADRPVRQSDAVVENMSRVVCSLLVKGFRGKLRTTDFWKLSIRINTRDPSADGKTLSGVLIACRSFPTEDFLGWVKFDRQRFMLEFVSATLGEVLRARRMDDTIVEEARKYVEEQNFVQIFIGKSEFASPAGLRARIECEQEMDVARIFVSLNLVDGRQHRVLVSESTPDEFVIQSFFGKIIWDELPELQKVDGTRIPIALTKEELTTRQ